MAGTFLLLPTEDKPFFEYSIPLSGVRVFLQFQWNTREGFWTLAILDATKSPIILGIKLALGVPLLNKHQDIRLPPGDIMIVDEEDSGVEPGRKDLGTRVLPYYVF